MCVCGGGFRPCAYVCVYVSLCLCAGVCGYKTQRNSNIIPQPGLYILPHDRTLGGPFRGHAAVYKILLPQRGARASDTATGLPPRSFAPSCAAHLNFFPEIFSFTNRITFTLGLWQQEQPFFINVSFRAVPEVERPGLELHLAADSLKGKVVVEE